MLSVCVCVRLGVSDSLCETHIVDVLCIVSPLNQTKWFAQKRSRILSQTHAHTNFMFYVFNDFFPKSDVMLNVWNCSRFSVTDNDLH